MTSWLAFFWTVHPVAALATQQSAAQSQYQEAMDDYNAEHPESARSANHSGNLKNGEVVSLEGDDPDVSGDKIKDDNVWNIIISILVFIVAAVVSIYFVIKCVNQPSAWIMVIGTLIFIIGEIVNWANFDKNIKNMTQKLEVLSKVTQEGKDLQVAAIDEYINLTQSAMDHTTARLVLAGIATALWFVGAIVALIEGILHVIPTVQYNDTCSGAGFFNQNNPAKFIAQKAFNTVLPEAHAGGGQDTFKSIGIGVVALVLVIAITSFNTIEQVLNAAKNSGFIRAAIFAVIGALGIVACVAVGEAKDTLERRKEKLEELKTKIEIASRDESGQKPKGQLANTKGLETGEFDQQSLDKQLKNGCGKSEPGVSGEVTQVDCQECAGDTCGNLNGAPDPETKLSGIKFPPAISSNFNDGKKGLKDLSNGRGLDGNMRNMGSGANIKRLLKTMKDVKGMGDNLLKKKGLPPMPDMDKAMAGHFNTIMNDGFKALRTLTPEQQAQLKAEMFGGPVSASDKLKDIADKNGMGDLFKKKSTAGAIGVENIDMSGAGGESLSSGPGKVAGDDIQAGVDNAKYLEGLRVKDQDVVNDESVTLWKVLSSRYQRSAFRWFFTEPAATPDPAPAKK
jgi:ABC-type dipeptide/oligopeptide/nickel transport system permease component